MDLFEPVLRIFRYLPMIIWISLVAFIRLFIPKSWYAKDVSEDIVLITGAGSGLGREIAIEYARQKASLVLWDINAAGLKETKELVEKTHSQVVKPENTNLSFVAARFCLTYLVDVSDREQVNASATQVQDDIDKLQSADGLERRYVSVLVNNAGIYHGLMFQDLKDHQIERIFKINILAHFWTVRAFLPKMIENQHGHIVEIASMGGISGHYKQVDYCSTKFATIGFEESLSLELMALGLHDKIYTTAVCPFFFQSNLFTGFDAKASSLLSCKYVAREAVMGMRCNHSKVMIPLTGSLLYLIKPITPRRALYLYSKMLNLTEGIRNIKGAASC